VANFGGRGAEDPADTSRRLRDLVWRSGGLFVAGPDTGAWMSQPQPGEAIVGLRLRPGIAGSLLGLPASELRGSRLPHDVWASPAAE
jgi:hypothetical protein